MASLGGFRRHPAVRRSSVPGRRRRHAGARFGGSSILPCQYNHHLRAAAVPTPARRVVSGKVSGSVPRCRSPGSGPPHRPAVPQEIVRHAAAGRGCEQCRLRSAGSAAVDVSNDSEKPVQAALTGFEHRPSADSKANTADGEAENLRCSAGGPRGLCRRTPSVGRPASPGASTNGQDRVVCFQSALRRSCRQARQPRHSRICTSLRRRPISASGRLSRSSCVCGLRRPRR